MNASSDSDGISGSCSGASLSNKRLGTCNLKGNGFLVVMEWLEFAHILEIMSPETQGAESMAATREIVTCQSIEYYE